MLNQLLGGRYRVVQNLEEGGLAKTYIVEDNHRPGCPKCAVKFLKPVSNQPEFLPTARRLFQQEAEILEKLGQHNQIPRLLAYFEENQKFYLVQEFIEGQTLSRELPRDHCWSERKVIEMLQDVLRILEFVHSYGVIHRDLKPNNLIRRQQDGRLVLIDFGAVKQVRAPVINNQQNYSSLTQKTIAIGTQGYMPTEQVRGKPRLNSDIYALGMVGIQALTGLHPLNFSEDEEGELIWQDSAQVSDELATILNNMVRYHFKDRYQSSTEVLEALQPLIEQHNLITTNSVIVSSPVESQLRGENHLGIKTLIPAIAEAITKINPVKINIEPKTELQKQQYDDLIQLWRSRKVSCCNFLAKSCAQPKKLLSAATKGLFTPSGNVNSNNALRLNKSQIILGTGITSAVIGIVTGYHHINQSHLQAEQALAQIEELQKTEKYSECLQKAQEFPQYYSYLQTAAANLRGQCSQSQAIAQLTQAKNLASQSKLKDAIALAAQVSEDTNSYASAQELISQWAEEIFQIASNKYQEGKLEEAITIAKAVPGDQTMVDKIQTITQQWQTEWQQNQAYIQTAQQKFEARRWQDAINAAQQVSNTDYWQQQSQPIIRQAKAKILAAQTAAQPTTQVTTTTRKQTSKRQRVNRTRSVNNSRPIRVSRPIITRPIKKSRSVNRPNSSPRYTSKMTCKYIGDHPKCPR